MENDYKKIFLASNGADGFKSYFKECYDPREGWRAFIIKGGPGTGKSSLMKTVAKTAKEKGLDPVLVFCSSDPDSLDGVILKEEKVVLLDGTAPHVVEPTLFGACEIIVNPGELLDYSQVHKHLKEIIEVTDKNKVYHLTASRYLAAAGQIKNDNLRIAHNCLDIKKVHTFAEKLSLKHFTKIHKKGRAFNCFISAVTSKGVINFTQTAKLWCTNAVVIEDKHEAAAREIMRYLNAAALSKGYDVIAVKDPLFPDTTAHLIIPELSLGFFCENEDISFDFSVRKIHSRRFYRAVELGRVKNRMRFNKRVLDALINSAAQNLKNAKAVHDEIESFYIAAMDFKGITKITEKLLKVIFNTKK